MGEHNERRPVYRPAWWVVDGHGEVYDGPFETQAEAEAAIEDEEEGQRTERF